MTEKLEERRLVLQAQLDAQKDQGERNRLGQFATPTGLARDILSYGRSLLGDETAVRFLDPAFGSGSFFSALKSVFPARQIEEAKAFEIDPHYGQPADELWKGMG